MPKHAGERKEPTARTSPDGDPAEIKVAALLGGTLERRDLVGDDRREDVAVDLPFPLRSSARGPCAVGHQDGKAVVCEPLGLDEVPVARPSHALGRRTAVGAQEHREFLGTGLIPRREG